jgi:energy-coupling factor transporter ATP-binding protein EcfA2
MIDLEPALQSPSDSVPPPRSVRDTGLELGVLVELTAKTLFGAGRTPLPLLTTRLRLSINVLREVLDFMVTEQLAEVAWRGASDIDVDYQLTGKGREHAGAWLERRPYVGPAPVPLDSYRTLLLRQAAQLPAVSAADVAAVFGDDCLPPRVHELVGAAMYAARSLFLYGPPGSGKSTLARKLGRLLQGTVLVPYAVAVGQEVVRVFDPALHQPPLALAGRPTPERRSSDLRWAACQRPLVQLGAELDSVMLDLQHDTFSGCYQAPPQIKANHGVFILDDLGRQRQPAAALLNRFSLALDTGMDQLALQGGYKFSVPFQAVLVLASSCEPQTLLDGAALRRIGYKVPVGALPEASYRKLFLQQCRLAGIEPDEAALAYLVGELHQGSGQPLLASLPRELLGRIGDFAGVAGQPPRLTPASLDQAWSSLFAGCAPLPLAGAERALLEQIA